MTETLSPPSVEQQYTDAVAWAKQNVEAFLTYSRSLNARPLGPFGEDVPFPDITITLRANPPFFDVWNEFFGEHGYYHGREDEEEAKKTITKAYILAEYGHMNQERKTGGYHIDHAIEVARRYGVNHCQPAWVIAGLLLHDVIEDSEEKSHTPVYKEDILRLFPGEIQDVFSEEGTLVTEGEKIYGLVDALSKVRSKRKDREFVETVHKLILEGINDPTVIGAKGIGDRSHNIETLYGLEGPKQQRMALETLVTLTPLIKAFGFYEGFRLVADECFRVVSSFEEGGTYYDDGVRYLRGQEILWAMQKRNTVHELTRFLFNLAKRTNLEIYVNNLVVPTAYELYQERRDPSQGLTQDDGFIWVDMVIDDPAIQTPEVLFKSGFDTILAFKQDKERRLRVPPDRNMGLALGMEQLEREEVPDYFEYYLHYVVPRSGSEETNASIIPLRFRIYTKAGYDEATTPLSYVHAIALLPQDKTELMTFEEEQQRLEDRQQLAQKRLGKLRARFATTTSDERNVSKSALVEHMVEVLPNSMSVWGVKKRKDESTEMREVSIPSEATVGYYALSQLPKSWQRVTEITVTRGSDIYKGRRVIGQMEGFDAILNFALKPNDKVSMSFSQRAENNFASTAWVRSVSIYPKRQARVYEKMQERYRKHPDRNLTKQIKEHAWELIHGQLTVSTMEPFELERVIRQFDPMTKKDAFLLNVGLGLELPERVKQFAQAVDSYWNSLVKVTVTAKDTGSGVMEPIVSLFEDSVLDVVAYANKTEPFDDDTSMVWWFDPRDPNFSRLPFVVDAVRDYEKKIKAGNTLITVNPYTATVSKQAA